MRRIRFIKNYYQKFYYYQNYQNFQNSFNKQLKTQTQSKTHTKPNLGNHPQAKALAGIMTTLFACSESLPFINKIESNGIIELIAKIFTEGENKSYGGEFDDKKLN